MNKVETKTLTWLQGMGYTDIQFFSAKTPDFVTGQGKCFEVKKICANAINFRYGQRESLLALGEKAQVVLFNEDGETIIGVVPFSVLDCNRWNNYYVRFENIASINVRLPPELWRKVKVKSAIEGKTIVEWLTELLKREVNK